MSHKRLEPVDSSDRDIQQAKRMRGSTGEWGGGVSEGGSGGGGCRNGTGGGGAC